MILRKRRQELQRRKPKNYEEELYCMLLMLWERWQNGYFENSKGFGKGKVILSDKEVMDIVKLLYPELKKDLKY